MAKVLTLRRALRGYSDQQLVERFQVRKDPQAIGILLDRYADQVIGIAFNVLKSREDAEDLRQELYFKLIRILPTVDLAQLEHFDRWFKRVIVNAALDAHRKRSRMHGRLNELAMRTELLPFAHDEELNETDMKQLETGLSQLSENERKCIELRFYQDLGYPDILAQTGWTLNQARGYRDRAIKRLKTIFGNLNAPPGDRKA